MEKTLLEFLKGQKENGYAVIPKEDLGVCEKECNKKCDDHILIVKLDDFALLHLEGDTKIQVVNLIIGEFIGTMGGNFHEANDVHELGEALGEWYYEDGGKERLRSQTMEYMEDKTGVSSDKLSKALDEVLDDLTNIIDRVTTEYFEEKKRR